MGKWLCNIFLTSKVGCDVNRFTSGWAYSWFGSLSLSLRQDVLAWLTAWVGEESIPAWTYIQPSVPFD